MTISEEDWKRGHFGVCYCHLTGDCHVSRGKGDHCELCEGPELADADIVEGMFVGYRTRVKELEAKLKEPNALEKAKRYKVLEAARCLTQEGFVSTFEDEHLYVVKGELFDDLIEAVNELGEGATPDDT